jgi:hypothetical protein
VAVDDGQDEVINVNIMYSLSSGLSFKQTIKVTTAVSKWVSKYYFMNAERTVLTLCCDIGPVLDRFTST